MQIALSGELTRTNDFELIKKSLPTNNSRLLELGCGTAQTTRQLAESLPIKEIIAMEVDEIQHEKNLQINDLPNVRFVFGGAQAIDLPDTSIDAVIMLKSLHHVPIADMDSALSEIARVLRPGGLAYISEPVYGGELNELIRLFHDEKEVREAAFDAICRVVETGKLELEDEIHFTGLSRFQGFSEFEQQVMGATHSEFDIDEALYEKIKAQFMQHVGDDGWANFSPQIRVDLLRKAG